MQTRTTNQDAHPGLAIPRQVRRTGEEMKMARAKKQQEEEEAEKSRTDKITGLANIESGIEKRHQRTKDTAANPPASKIAVKIPRTVSNRVLLAVVY